MSSMRNSGDEVLYLLKIRKDIDKHSLGIIIAVTSAKLTLLKFSKLTFLMMIIKEPMT